MATKTIGTVHQESISANRLWKAGLATVAASAIANLALYWIGTTFLGVPNDSQMLQPFSIIITSIVAGIGATVVLWAVSRFSRRPIWLFRIVAAVVLVLSLIGPISAATGAMPTPGGPVNAATALIMVAMHIATAAIAVGLLTTMAREK